MEKREANKAGKEANKGNLENEKKRANMSDPSIMLNPEKKKENEEEGLVASPGPQNSSLNSEASVMSDDYSMRSSP